MNSKFLLFLLFAVIACPACAQQDEIAGPEEVSSVLSGQITVSVEVDSVPDYRGFEVLVAVDVDGAPDTLGYGVTDSTGAFSLEVTAPSRGRYSLIISRRGQILKVGALAVAEGDSASLRAEFPMEGRPLRIRSLENAAWMAYENTMAQHEQSLLHIVRSGEYNENRVHGLVLQSSSILWGLQETFPGAMGGELAAAEAVLLVAGWDDSLAVARAHAIAPGNVSFVDVARAARTAQARLAGQEAAIALLLDFGAAALTEADRAELAFEVIAARIDSMQYDAALERALDFKAQYADTPYEEWGDRAIYELEHLIPGREAPAFALRDVRGDSLRLRDFLGQRVLLEFYHPRDDVYERELEGRNALYTDAANLEIVSISLAPDTLISEAFFDSRDIPGRHVLNPSGLALLYNVNVLPTRFLISAEGRIAAKYVGSAMAAVYHDLVVDEQ